MGCRATGKEHKQDPTSLAWAPDAKHIAVGTFGKVVLILEAVTLIDKTPKMAAGVSGFPPAEGESKRQSSDADAITGFKGSVYGAKWSRDGSRLVTHDIYQHEAWGRCDNLIRLWDLTTRNEIAALPLRGHGTSDLEPNGRLLATGGTDCAVHIWNATDGTEVRSVPFPHIIETVAFKPNGGYLAVQTGGTEANGRLQADPLLNRLMCSIWKLDPGTGNKLLVFQAAYVRGIVWSPDGRYLAGNYGSAYGDNKIVVWDMKARGL